jgi:hypothetical protein
MSRNVTRWQLHHTLMLAILFIGLFIRFHGLIWTLPYFFLGDETRIVANGISIHETGIQNYASNVTDMGNYPPYVGWEIALTRGAFFTIFGSDNVPISLVVLFARMFSLFYALLTMASLYQLGRLVTRSPYGGLAAALFFAVWPQTVMFGQRALSDGAGLMFFTLSAWLSVLAYQRLSYRALTLAVVAAILAGLGKFNYFPALMMPGLAGLYFLYKRPRQMVIWVVLPSILLSAPIIYATSKTISRDDIFYNYLNEEAQLENAVRTRLGEGYTPADPEMREVYDRYPVTFATRIAENYRTLTGFLPELTLAMVLLGLAAVLWWRGRSADMPSLLGVILVGLLTFLAYSWFRVVEGRQLFGVMIPLILLWAVGVRELMRVSRVAAGVILLILVFPPAFQAWNLNNEISKPDTRVATVNWFLENARDGTGIALENQPYEFWTQNGYPGEKQFNVFMAYRLFERSPRDWENDGYYYLVADDSFAWRGGYYAGHELIDEFDSMVEVVARFEGDAYTGPDRIIMRSFRPQVIVDAQFGDVVTFYGYDVAAQSLLPGDTLHVKYYWRADEPDGVDYIIFNHLIDAESGEQLTGFDRLAGHNGTHPSSQWESLEWLFDEFELEIPQDTPPGDYLLQMGLYRAEDGTRLAVDDAEDNVLTLMTIAIEDEPSESVAESDPRDS